MLARYVVGVVLLAGAIVLVRLPSGNDNGHVAADKPRQLGGAGEASPASRPQRVQNGHSVASPSRGRSIPASDSVVGTHIGPLINPDEVGSSDAPETHIGRHFDPEISAFEYQVRGSVVSESIGGFIDPESVTLSETTTKWAHLGKWEDPEGGPIDPALRSRIRAIGSFIEAEPEG